MFVRLLSMLGIDARREELVPGDRLQISTEMIDKWYISPLPGLEVVRVDRITINNDGTKLLHLTNVVKST